MDIPSLASLGRECGGKRRLPVALATLGQGTRQSRRTRPSGGRVSPHYRKLWAGMKINIKDITDILKRISCLLSFPLLTFTLLSFLNVAYASTGWPHDFARDIFLFFFVLPTVVFAGWVIVHLWNRRKSVIISTLMSLYDLAAILLFGVFFSVFVMQGIWGYCRV